MSNKKAQNQSSVVKLALIGSLGIAFFYLNDGLNYLSMKIAELPVQGKQEVAAAPTQDPVAASTALVKNMHPLLVESKTKADALRRASDASPDTNFDALFGRDVAQKELDDKRKKELDLEKAAAAAKSAPAASAPVVPVLPPVDQFKLVAQKVRVQAVMKGGAVINDAFCELGTEVKTLGYPSQDGQKVLYPTLFSVEGEVVLLAEAGGGVRKIKAKLLH